MVGTNMEGISKIIILKAAFLKDKLNSVIKKAYGKKALESRATFLPGKSQMYFNPTLHHI